MKAKKISALLIAVLLVLMSVPAASFAAGPMTLSAVSDEEIYVYSPAEKVRFEVRVNDPVPGYSIKWYKIDRFDMIIGVDEAGNYKVYSENEVLEVTIPAEEANVTQYYKCIAQKDNDYAELVFSCTLVSDSAPYDEFSLEPGSPTEVVVDSPDVEFGFDVKVVGPEQAPWVYWFETDENGDPLEVDADGLAIDCGQGGTSLLMFGIPETLEGKWLYYKAYAVDEFGNHAECLFKCMLDMTPEEEFERVIDMELLTEPSKKEYRPGEKPDLTGFKVRLWTNMGFRDTTDASEFSVYPETFTEEGQQKISIEYQGHYSVSCTVEVKPEEPEYTIGEVVIMPFDDVEKDVYYYDAVVWAYYSEPQITDGTTAATFSPERTCTRGQVVTFLWRAMGKPEPKSTKNPFVDVLPGDYFYDAVLWAVEKGITDGTDATHFSPNKDCRNSHILTFIYRAMGEPNKTGAGDWYTDAYNWANFGGLLNGTFNGSYDVNGLCPRKNVVQYLYRHYTME